MRILLVDDDSAFRGVMANELKVTAIDWLFWIVTDWLALLTPTLTLPNARVVGDTVTGVVPTPVRFTRCGLPNALVLMPAVAERTPPTVGWNVIETVQFAPAFSFALQVVAASEKSAGAGTMVTSGFPSVN